MLDDYKLSSEDKKSIEEKNKELNKKNLYLEFINSQRNGFYRFINYLNETIFTLQQQAKISDFIEVRARIKDINSALKNDETKALDDVFGVEIVCEDEEEINIIQNHIEKKMVSKKNKDHNKDNGYKAKHRSYSSSPSNNIDNDKWYLEGEDVPVIECQFKTIAVDRNKKASHHDYKNVDEELTRKKLKTTILKIGEEIPEMWIARNGTIRKLTYKETIHKIYPFVDITDILEPENFKSFE